MSPADWLISSLAVLTVSSPPGGEIAPVGSRGGGSSGCNAVCRLFNIYQHARIIVGKLWWGGACMSSKLSTSSVIASFMHWIPPAILSVLIIFIIYFEHKQTKSQICAHRKKSRPSKANVRLRVKGRAKVSRHLERGRHQPSTQNKK